MRVASVFYAVSILWAIIALLCYALPHHLVFEILDAFAIASGIVVMLAYAPALVDAWRNRSDKVTAAHVLALGIISNWLGFIIRLGRWYVTNIEPVEVGSAAQWAYNVGLGISIMAAFFLIWAVAVSDPKWPRSRTITYCGLFVAITIALLLVDALT